MPGRRSLGRSAGWLAASVFVASGIVLPACASTGFHYVKSSEDRTYFKVPAEWKLYDNDALLDASAADLSADELDARRDSSWATVFDGHPSPALAHVANKSPKYPVGQAIVQELTPETADSVSLKSLRNLFYEVDQKIEKETAEVVSYESVERDGGFHGSRMVARLTTQSGDVVVNQVVLLDQKTSKVYALAVSCATECYDRYESEIDEIVDSWTVKGG